MKTKPNTYFGAVALLGLITFVIMCIASPAPHITTGDIIGVVVLMGVAYISEYTAFHVGSSTKFAASIAQIPFLSAIVLFPPIVAVPAIAAAVFAANTYPLRRSPIKTAFNVSQAALSAAAAGIVYHSLVGNAGHGSVAGLPSFAEATIIFLLVNMGLVAGALSTIRQQRFSLVFGDVAGRQGSNLLDGLLSSPIALIIVLLYDRYQGVGLVVVLLPLLLVRTSFANNVALQKANKDLLKVLIKAIETRDPYTSGHSLRVASLAVVIAEDLGLPKQRVDEVEIAALLHDVGKIDPSFSAVIRKPYDLSVEERALIQTHAALGADLLHNLKSVRQPIVDAVRHHHERMDGAGYPDGLRGNEIPLPARIIMLCDSIDAMLSDRPYRKALSMDRVRQELIRCSGDQFDPEIVKVVLQKDTLTRASRLIDTVSGFEDEYLIRAQG